MSTAILITARLKSTRLKRKVLREIEGRPMLSHMIERLRQAKIPEKIILCTSTVEQDDDLEHFAKSEGIECYRGHPDDVLLRMNAAAKEFGVETVVSCTADNPFVDPVYIDNLIAFHHAEKNDFSCSEGLPFGTFAYALNQKSIEKACLLKDEVDTEVWGGYFTQTGAFQCGVMKVVDISVRWPELRLTVDTLEDFNLVAEVFSRLYHKGSVFSLAKIVQLCRDNPSLVMMNAKVKQASVRPIKLK